MNKAQKEVLKASLDDEKKTIRELKQVYKRAKLDVEERIRELSARTDMENLQSIIYQQKYQEALKKQLDDVLDKLNKNQFNTIEEYLKECYENGYIGTMYDLQHQGIPLTVPIDQEQVVKALKTDTKLSSSKYKGDPLKGRVEEDVDKLKVSIRAELSRSVASGSSWNEVAVKIAMGMNNPFEKAYRNALLIARTEGHRVQQSGKLDACNVAKNKGADIVKQWDSTLDGLTRPEHRKADGQIRELDDDFDVWGEKLKAPAIGGSPRNVCNCRCQLLQRARWALDEAELKTLQERAEYFGLDKSADLDDFKQKYLKLPKNADTMKITDVLNEPVDTEEEHYKRLLGNLGKMDKVYYNPVKNHTSVLSEDEIIKALSGGDKTSGSCASVGLAYIGQKQGLDVLDFRGGVSCDFFSRGGNLHTLSQAEGLKVLKAEGACSMTVGNRLLKQCEVGKEYYLCVGRHASIVRKTNDGVIQYLELQSATNSGWIDFNGNPRYTLKTRFGCTNTSGPSALYDFMIDLEESDFDTDEFKSLLGYINTSETEQRKGLSGTIK